VAVDALAAAGIETLADPAVTLVELDCPAVRAATARRILYSLQTAARSLTVTEADAKEAGWFDPVIVGAEPFPDGTRKPNRRKYWDLTDISQLWLRNLLWEYLRHSALGAAGKRPSQTNIYQRISSVRLFSKALRQLCEDHGDDPSQLGPAEATAFKELWDLWCREQLLVVERFTSTPPTSHPISASIRVSCMNLIRDILSFGCRRQLLGSWADSFVMALPHYAHETRTPRPRPLSNNDFRLLVSDKALAELDAADLSGIGLSDIWLTHAFQGGRISETLQLRLGCIGMIGDAQPYLWRDMSKVKEVDYGMPCHWPVYERLKRRQEITRGKLRHRYAKELSSHNEVQRAALEAEWDNTMPLFPGAVTNPDIALPISQHHFGRSFTEWIAGLGLEGVTTHRTRATLATALLNNGAPAALVRQLLGHFSERSMAHYARYSDENLIRNLHQVWTAGPGMNQPGTNLLTPGTAAGLGSKAALAERIDLTVIPVEHGLCRYGPVVGGKSCPAKKNCSRGPDGPCPHFVITGADLAYWERKRDAAFHFAESAPSDEARDYILSEWQPWEGVLDGLRETLDEIGLLKAAEELDLRTPLHDFFHPLFSAGWTLASAVRYQDAGGEVQSA
jgi:integrase